MEKCGSQKESLINFFADGPSPLRNKLGKDSKTKHLRTPHHLSKECPCPLAPAVRVFSWFETPMKHSHSFLK